MENKEIASLAEVLKSFFAHGDLESISVVAGKSWVRIDIDGEVSFDELTKLSELFKTTGIDITPGVEESYPSIGCRGYIDIEITNATLPDGIGDGVWITRK